MSLFDDYDIDLSDFCFEELENHDVSDEFHIYPSRKQSTLTGTYVKTLSEFTRKRKCKEIRVTKSRKQTKRPTNPVETVIKLPDEVRSTAFAEFMLEDRFKFVPENRSSSDSTDLKLYNFPRFSRCDALFYFPATLVSFMNSGDADSATDLFKSFLHKDCAVSMKTRHDIPLALYLARVRLFLDLHPDQIMCMHSTKDVDNEIRSDLYFKCTNNRVVYDSVARTWKDSVLSPILVPSRAERLQLALGVTPKCNEEDQQFRSLLDSDSDVEIYGHVDFRLCYNKHSKKVMHMSVLIDITSYQPINTPVEEVLNL